MHLDRPGHFSRRRPGSLCHLSILTIFGIDPPMSAQPQS